MNKSRLVYGAGLIALALAVFFLGSKAKNKGHFSWSKKNSAAITVADSLSVNGVTELNANGACDVIIIPSDDERVVFYYDKKDVENRSQISGTTLNLDFDSKENGFFSNHSSDVTVKIYSKHISKIAQDGVCDIKTEGLLSATDFDVRNEGVGSMDLELQAQSITISNQGVGSIDLKGDAANATIENGGTGSIDARKMTLKNAVVRNQGVGSIELQASETLDLSNQGVGSIDYSGTAKVTRSESQGVGSINKH